MLRFTWKSRAGDTLEIALALMATALVAPISWYHDEVFALVGLTLAWRSRISNPSRASLVLAFLLIDAQGALWHRLVGATALLPLANCGLLVAFAVTLSARRRTFRRRRSSAGRIWRLDQSATVPQ